MNPFRDQEKFMRACDQSVGEFNVAQFNLYTKLIEEEFKELGVAIEQTDRVETLDALIDILVVTIGALQHGRRCRRCVERSHRYKLCQD